MTASSGGTGSPLTSDPADETEPDWSPDGGRIVFQRGDGIAIMRADGSAQAPARRRRRGRVARVVARRRPDRVRARSRDPHGDARGDRRDAADHRRHHGAHRDQPELAVDSAPGAPRWRRRPAARCGRRRRRRRHRRLDCDDANPAIRPARRTSPATRSTRTARAGTRGLRCWHGRSGLHVDLRDARYTVFTSLTSSRCARAIASDSRARARAARCKAKVKVKKKAKKRSLPKYLKGAKLRNGAVLRVRAPQGNRRPGRHLEDRADKPPKVARTCVRPGAKKLSSCPRR